MLYIGLQHMLDSASQSQKRATLPCGTCCSNRCYCRSLAPGIYNVHDAFRKLRHPRASDASEVQGCTRDARFMGNDCAIKPNCLAIWRYHSSRHLSEVASSQLFRQAYREHSCIYGKCRRPRRFEQDCLAVFAAGIRMKIMLTKNFVKKQQQSDARKRNMHVP